ncbi:MAG: hypothetical protein ACEY3J_00220 [Arsenophonus sp.]
MFRKLLNENGHAGEPIGVLLHILQNIKDIYHYQVLEKLGSINSHTQFEL